MCSSTADQLREVIGQNGQQRDEEHRTAGDVSSNFAADLVLRDGTGFELWLGSLDDALCLEDLRARRIGAVLNCAVEESERECAVYRAGARRRSRTHARGPSVMDGSNAKSESEAGGTAVNLKGLDKEQVRSLALFDGEWYSSMLGYDVAYLGVAADDEAGYDMSNHFRDVVSFLTGCQKEKRHVLIHCIMGINRSSAALVAFLCEGMGMSLANAVDVTASKRGYILSNASFLDQLVSNYGDDASASPELGLTMTSEEDLIPKQVSSGYPSPRRRSTGDIADISRMNGVAGSCRDQRSMSAASVCCAA